MKKFFAAAFTFVLLLLACVIFVACGAHTHSYSQWTVEKAATCTEDGLRYRECTGCHEREEEVISKTGHTPVTEDGLAPTCTQAGYVGRIYCDVCNVEISPRTTIGELGHSFGEFETVQVDGEFYHSRVCTREGCGEVDGGKCELTQREVAATCYADAYTEKECEVCGLDITEVHEHTMRAHKLSTPKFDEKKRTHIVVCEYEDCDFSDEEECVFDAFTIEPSCLEDGYARYTCSICSGQYEETKQALGHSYDDWVTDEDATCTEAGRQHRDCLNCETVEVKQLNPLGHDWKTEYIHNEGERTHYSVCKRDPQHTKVEGCAGLVTNVPATCLEDGYAEFVCEYCKQDYKNKTVDKLGHDFSGDYIERLVSDEDGAVGADMQGKHRHTHYQVCRRADCGVEKSEDCSLTLRPELTREANCYLSAMTVETCDKCGSRHETVTAPALGHTWGDYQNGGLRDRVYHFRRCTVCNAYDYSVYCTFETVVHQPTCDEEGYTERRCVTCGYGVQSKHQPALGHIWGGYVYSGDLEEHTHTRECLRDGCDEKDVGECDMVEFDKAATCTAAGGSGYTCKYCKVNITKNEYKQLDHEWVIMSGPTNDVTHTRKCAKCMTTEAVEHSYDEEIVPADCENPGYEKKTCTLCAHVYTVQIADQLAVGHSWMAWEITDARHKSECVTCHKIVDEEHVYDKSNLCDLCEHDGMAYLLQGDHYIVKRNSALNKVKSVIIKPYHSSIEDGDGVHPVTEIDRYAFENFSLLERVELPFTLEKIGAGAFYCCANLFEVFINEELVIENPEGEDDVQTHVASLKLIDEYAFMEDKALKSFEAPTSLVKIGRLAFSGCITLTDITIPDTVEDIGSNAFRNTGYLGDEGKWQDDCLYIGMHLIAARHHFDENGEATNKRINVKSGTVTIAASAFENCKYLEVVELPKTLKIVDENAFAGCENLVEVIFDGELEDWLNIRFVNDLSSPLHFASRLHIDEHQERLVIPNGVTRIPAGTFRNTGIKEVVIPESVKYIGANAFAGCTELLSVSIEDSVIYIGKDAFKDTAYMNDPANWDESGAFYAGRHLICTDSSKMKGTYNIRTNTASICAEAFAGCNELEAIVIPAGVKRIGANVVKDCAKLKSVVFDGAGEFFANSLRLNISRVLNRDHGLSNGEAGASQLKIYDGEWVLYSLYGTY